MTELIWDGKYGPDGRKTAPVRLALPFQDVETVNESAQVRTRMLDLWGRGRPGEWRNRLIWGDKKYVLPSLLPEFAGKVNLIYVDPPFATGADFSFTAAIPDDPNTEGDQSATFVKQPSMIEQKAYRDTWGRGLDSYLQWFYETAVLLHELLAETGSLYTHGDWRLIHYVRPVLDELFGAGFRNDIIWHYGGRGAKAIAGQFPRNHDVILLYTKSNRATFNSIYIERRVPLENIASAGYRTDEQGRVFKTSPRGDYTDASIERLKEEGRIHVTQGGNIRIKYFLRHEGQYVVEDQLVGDVWTDIPDAMHMPQRERTSYPTQKPEALLERIIKASSNEDDLVLDCFVGSGTTAAVAEKLNRRWIAADLSRFAVNTTRKRLLSIPEVRPFVVQNLGKYERQAWQGAAFGQDRDRAAEAQARYRRFILDLYGAEPLEGYVWLHGLRAGHFVHVSSVDAPVVEGDVRAIAREFWQAVGKGAGATSNHVDVLGWDFAFELNEMGKQLATDANIHMAFKRIPRDVMDKKAVEQGDIHFFELAALDLHVDWKPNRTMRVELRDFVVPPDDIPKDVLQAITHWSQLIDYWAVDWDCKGDTFHNQWQSYRTKKQPKLALAAERTYEAPGSYTILVKVIDILGNDTTKRVTVEAS